jgi:hypothetical protein
MFFMLKRMIACCLVYVCVPLFSLSQNRYDILITECLPDPSPVVGLPESSFIELKNRSLKDIHLLNWKISNGTSTSSISNTDYILMADSFLILCNTSSVKAFRTFGPTLGVTGFPGLNNDAGDIILSTADGTVVHAIHYDKSWFRNELKAEGGWSLEMIDPSNPSMGEGNWAASISMMGGTPGKQNSVYAQNPDLGSPSLLRAITRDSLDLILIFDEAMDSLSVSFLSDYILSDGIGSPVSVIALPPFFDRMAIRLQNPLARGKIYSVTVRQLYDCGGNEISTQNTCSAGIPEKIKSGDIIFNEILFNPPPNGYDYLELYNRSNKIINCSELFLAGREINGSWKDPVPLVKEEFVFFPGEYLLITENPQWVLRQYPLADPNRIISLSPLPSLPDDAGKVVLLNASGEIVDELDYDHHWQSPLLADESGVALERIRPELSTAAASNWTSASAPSGYGTPGYKNSESSFLTDSSGMEYISLEPKIFSPDMDGYRDFCFIQYHLPASGFMGSLSVYDIRGRMVNKLADNSLWGRNGSFRWDGLDDQQNPLPMGHYIIYVELFRTDGWVFKQKLVCTLARKSY